MTVREKGLYAKLKNHYASSLGNTVLARHLAADTASDWAMQHDFKERSQRQAFLADHCYFQAIPLPDIDRLELERFELFVESAMRPRYARRVGFQQRTTPTWIILKETGVVS